MLSFCIAFRTHASGEAASPSRRCSIFIGRGCGRQCAHGFHRMCPGRDLVPHAHCRQGIRAVMRIGRNRVSAPVLSFWKCAKEVELISIRPLA